MTVVIFAYTSMVIIATGGTIYDLTKVTVGHRYADCDSFKAPCCNTEVDTRPFKKDYDRITYKPKREGERG